MRAGCSRDVLLENSTAPQRQPREHIGRFEINNMPSRGRSQHIAATTQSLWISSAPGASQTDGMELGKGSAALLPRRVSEWGGVYTHLLFTPILLTLTMSCFSPVQGGLCLLPGPKLFPLGRSA